MIFFGGGVLLVAIALHIAWVGKRAEAKGRSVPGWVGLGLALCVVGVKLGLVLLDRAPDVSSNAVLVLYATAPMTLGLAPLIVIVLVLLKLPVRVAARACWAIHEARQGDGTLAIAGDAVELRWATGHEHIARAGLEAEVDGEMLRLRWHDGATGRELAVMPTGKPATREGRMRQAEIIAARLRA